MSPGVLQLWCSPTYAQSTCGMSRPPGPPLDLVFESTAFACTASAGLERRFWCWNGAPVTCRLFSFHWGGWGNFHLLWCLYSSADVPTAASATAHLPGTEVLQRARACATQWGALAGLHPWQVIKDWSCKLWISECWKTCFFHVSNLPGFSDGCLSQNVSELLDVARVLFLKDIVLWFCLSSWCFFPPRDGEAVLQWRCYLP